MPPENSTAIAPQAPPVDDRGHLAADIECRRCGYNLRGVALAGACPECRTAVGRSVHGDLLRFSDPAWVERVARGAQWFVAAILAGIAGGLVVAAILVASITAGVAGAPLFVVVLVLMTALVAVQLYAYWLVTTPDPGRDESGQPFTARAIARYALLASSVISMAQMMADPSFSAVVSGGGVPAAGAAPPFILLVIVLTNSVVGLVGIGALFIYARAIAVRIPDDRLGRQTRIVTIGYLVPAALAAAVQFVGLALAGGSPIVEVIVGLISLATAVFGIWGIVLVFKFRNRLLVAAQEARGTWARAE